tara:strand:- start:546 stop:947 length:402 start_codon:yes stop_codon:yes gene_type:complete
MEETTPGDETSDPEVVFVGQPATVNVNSAPQVSGGTQTPTNAVASLVLAILGIMTVIGGASICMPFCGLCFTIPAMFLVSSDMKKIADNALHTDSGMIKAANVINIISLVLAILGIVIWVLFFGGIAALGASA